MTNIGKLKIHWSFYLFVIIIIALGYIKQLFFLLAITTLHELSHVAAAKMYGLKPQSLLITPVGETAYIEGFDSISAERKAIILLAGPLANIIPALLLVLLSGYINYPEELVYISFSIGFFNLLPIYPFDGGRLLFALLGNRIGILKSVRAVRLCTKTGIAALIAVGFIQLVLFPLNISLLAISIFLAAIYQREKGKMLFSYYKCMLNKNAALCNGLKCKTAVCNENCRLEDISRLFTWDYYHIIYVVKNGKQMAVFTEKQIFEQIMEAGAGTEIKFLDIISKDDIIG